MTLTLTEPNKLLIGGTWQKPVTSTTHQIVCPADEAVLGAVPAASPSDVDSAVAAARDAYSSGSWSALDVEERATVLTRALEHCRDALDNIAETAALELGQPLAQTQRRTRGALDVFADAIAAGRVLSGDELRVDKHSNKTAIIQRRPAGVIAAITPFNGPFSMLISKLARALMAGCSVVAKPSLEGSLQTFYLAEALASAGLPSGVASILPGGPEAGRHLVEHADIDLVTFTGSTSAGRRIAQACGVGLKRTMLELGGKSAAVVLDDADLNEALPWLALGGFGAAGQVCIALTRVLAPRRRYDEVVQRLAAEAQGFRAGHPLDPATTLGALINQRQHAWVSSVVDSATSDGAKVAAGGGRPEGLDKGWFYAPTVLSDVHNSMRVARDEIFGPVVVVIPYDDEAEAVAIANDSPFGLHGAVFSADDDHAVRIAEQIRTGTCAINGYGILPNAPFGGVKSSGWGREGGPESLSEYTEIRTLIVDSDYRTSDQLAVPA